MLPSEPQIFKFLSENYPTVLGWLIATSFMIWLAFKLYAFLGRIEKLERELVSQKADWVTVKKKVAHVVLIHCQRHHEDMEKLMRIGENEDE